jgi:hypothetical protein
MNKTTRRYLVAGFGLLALVAVVAFAHARRSRSALERYETELRARGEKLTLAELPYSITTTGQQALAALMVAASGLSHSNLHPSTLEIMRLDAPGQARVLWREQEPITSDRKGKPVSGGWADLGGSLRANEPSFAAIRQALRNPPVNLGSRPTLYGGNGQCFVRLRTAAQALSGAVIVHLHQEEYSAAKEDLLAMISLARLNREEYTLVAQMIRVAIAGLGLADTWEALQAPDWTDEQLATLQHAWEDVDLSAGLETAFMGARASAMEHWMDLRNGGSLAKLQRASIPSPPQTGIDWDTVVSDCVYTPAYRVTSISDDELLYLRTTTEILAGLRSLSSGQPWREVKPGIDRFAPPNVLTNGLTSRLRYPLTSIMLPNFSHAIEIAIHAEMFRRLAVTAIAVKRFQIRHTNAPPNLAALVSEFLASPPIDLMSGKPLGYHLKEDGKFVLYSVGNDGRDDGGDSTGGAKGKFGLWDGHDAVWPSPK